MKTAGVRELLSKAKVEELVFPMKDTRYMVQEPIIQVESHTSVGETLQLMVDNRISAVPVYSDEKNKYLGFVDRLDFVAHILSQLSENENPGEEDIDRVALAAGSTPVKDIIGMSKVFVELS